MSDITLTEKQADYLYKEISALIEDRLLVLFNVTPDDWQVEGLVDDVYRIIEGCVKEKAEATKG